MRARSAILTIALALSAGCGAIQRHGLDALQDPAGQNCLVLSAGPAGVAHLGAIEVLREACVPVTCVVGTSMGAVVGALCPSSPQADTTARFEHFATAYVRTTRAEAESSSGLGGIIGAMIGVVAAGGVGAVLLGAAGGAMLGGLSVRPADQQRFVRVLDAELGGACIEGLPVAFTTMHQVRSENSADVVVQESGSLSAAVGASAANPFIFSDLEPRSMARMDPGLDRRSAVPVDQACDAHPGARLIVINVTHERARLLAGQACEMVEVRVPMPSGVALPAALQPGPAFRQVVDAGRRATRAALGGYTAP